MSVGRPRCLCHAVILFKIKIVLNLVGNLVFVRRLNNDYPLSDSVICLAIMMSTP